MTSEKREEILRELRECSAHANVKHGFTRDPDEDLKNLRAWQAKNGMPSEAMDDADAQPIPVHIKWTDNCQSMNERFYNFAVTNLSQIKARIEADSKNVGCYSYTVLKDGDRYLVWRDNEDAE